jgi:hypothetical protein
MRVTMKGNFKRIMRMKEKEMKRVDKATARALERFGAIVRQDAKKLIGSYAKTKKGEWKTVDGKRTFVVTPASKPRPPGSPPRNRTNNDFYTLRNIRYITDFRKRRVRIGPWKTGRAKYNGLTIPEIHEFGARVMVRVAFVESPVTFKDLKRTRAKIDPITGKRLRGKDGRFITSSKERLTISGLRNRSIIETNRGGVAMLMQYPKRPFMRPAYLKHKNKCTQIWIDYYKATKRKAIK